MCSNSGRADQNSSGRFTLPADPARPGPAAVVGAAAAAGFLAPVGPDGVAQQIFGVFGCGVGPDLGHPFVVGVDLADGPVDHATEFAAIEPCRDVHHFLPPPVQQGDGVLCGVAAGGGFSQGPARHVEKGAVACPGEIVQACSYPPQLLRVVAVGVFVEELPNLGGGCMVGCAAFPVGVAEKLDPLPRKLGQVLNGRDLISVEFFAVRVQQQVPPVIGVWVDRARRHAVAMMKLNDFDVAEPVQVDLGFEDRPDRHPVERDTGRCPGSGGDRVGGWESDSELGFDGGEGVPAGLVAVVVDVDADHTFGHPQTEVGAA